MVDYSELINFSISLFENKQEDIAFEMRYSGQE